MPILISKLQPHYFYPRFILKGKCLPTICLALQTIYQCWCVHKRSVYPQRRCNNVGLSYQHVFLNACNNALFYILGRICVELFTTLASLIDLVISSHEAKRQQSADLVLTDATSRNISARIGVSLQAQFILFKW